LKKKNKKNGKGRSADKKKKHANIHKHKGEKQQNEIFFQLKKFYLNILFTVSSVLFFNNCKLPE
jgi:hypothetical protein